MIRKSITNNPNSSTIATIFIVLSVLNDAITEFGALFFNDRTVTIISSVFLALTFIYNELKERGIIKSAKLKVTRFFNK